MLIHENLIPIVFVYNLSVIFLVESPKEPPRAKDFSHFRKPGKDVEKGRIEPEIHSFENSHDISIVSSDFDDLSLNTSLNLSDEIDPLKSY